MRRLAAVLGLACLPLPTVSAQADAPSATLERRLEVPLEAGHLRVADLVRVLLAEFQLDGEGLPLPELRVDVRGLRGSLLLLGARKLLLDTVRLRRDLDAGRLLITVDRERVRDRRRELRAALAALGGRLLGQAVATRQYGLPLPEALDPGRPLVVLVHGIESDPECWADLRAHLETAVPGCQLTAFAYPNDESVERVAAELAARLRALAPQPVILVGHSLGGLIARATVEDPALDPGNVARLVLLGTPHAGSNLAGLRVALELADLWRDGRAAEPFAAELLAVLADHWRDGLGEAGGDVWPGSVFLTRLAQRQRNARVDYRAVLGTRSLLDDAQLAALRAVVAKRLAGNEIGRVLRPRFTQWIADLDEIVDGRGDGAVSVARGRLAGVEPVLVPLDHVGLIRRHGLLGAEIQGEHPVFRAVAEWIALPIPAPAPARGR